MVTTSFGWSNSQQGLDSGKNGGKNIAALAPDWRAIPRARPCSELDHRVAAFPNVDNPCRPSTCPLGDRLGRRHDRSSALLGCERIRCPCAVQRALRRRGVVAQRHPSTQSAVRTG